MHGANLAAQVFMMFIDLFGLQIGIQPDTFNGHHIFKYPHKTCNLCRPRHLYHAQSHWNSPAPSTISVFVCIVQAALISFWWPPSILSFVQGGVLEAKGLRHWRVQLDGGATAGLNQNLIFVQQFSRALSTPQRILWQRDQKLMEVEVPWLRVIVGDSTRLVPWSKCSPNKFGRLTPLSFKKNRRISASTAARPLTSFRFK